MRQKGFSLIEVVVAMCILGILAAIAIPSYINYTHSANRSDATRSMTLVAQALERCYSQGFAYLGNASCPGAGAASSTQNSTQGYYTLTIALQASNYSIVAVPATAPQTGDSACAQFTLNSNGAQSAKTGSGSMNTQACWGST